MGIFLNYNCSRAPPPLLAVKPKGNARRRLLEDSARLPASMLDWALLWPSLLSLAPATCDCQAVSELIAARQRLPLSQSLALQPISDGIEGEAGEGEERVEAVDPVQVREDRSSHL